MKVQDWVYCNKPSKQPDFVIITDKDSTKLTVQIGDTSEQYYEEDKIDKMIAEMKTYTSW